MAQIVWTEQSIEDIDSIGKFISRDAPDFAKIFIQKIFNMVENLEEFPTLGRIVPEFNSKFIREMIYGNYRIVYRLKKVEIEIITIHHSSLKNIKI